MTTPLDDAPELCRLTAQQLAAAYATGALSPMEVVSATLDRADTINPQFHAFTTIDHDGALTAARASESRWRSKSPHGPLDGIPTTIKDIVAVRSWSVTYGSKTAPAGLAADDAPAVAALRAAGAVIIGQTTTPEFGWKAVTDSPRYGLTRNPWNPQLTPGGSSGGAAVAAATGAGVIHLGTDGGGSIRIPAAFTGIAGIKPTFGQVPAFPPSAFGTLSHIGPMARTATDLQTALAVMAARDQRDWHQSPTLSIHTPKTIIPKSLHLGIWRDCPGLKPTQDILAAFDTTLQTLQSAGVTLTPITLPETDLTAIFETLWFSGAANRLHAVPETLHHLIDPGLLTIAEQGRKFTATDYIAAATARAAYGAAMDRLLAKFDALISPATAIPPFAAGALLPENSTAKYWHEWAGFSFPINLSQQPACVIPSGRLPNNLPAAIQLVAPRMADSQLLDIAIAIVPLLGTTI